MSKLLIEHRAIPLLGKRERADKLVDWSLCTKKGLDWTRDFAHGLRLGFIADGNSPRIYIYWSQLRFRAFLSGLPFQPERLFFVDWGFCINHTAGRTRVTMPGVGATKVTLWDSNLPFCRENALSRNFWVIGMVKLSEEEGPTFFERPETQAELREATALACFRIDREQPKVTPKTTSVLPPSPQLRRKASINLLHEALLNETLRLAALPE